MSRYEQQVTIVLTEAEAAALRVALDGYIRSTENYPGRKIHPRSSVGMALELLDQLHRSRMGDKSTALVSFEMVEAV